MPHTEIIPQGKAPTMEHETLALLTHRLGTMHQDMGEMKNAIHKLTAVVTKTTVMEQELVHMKAANERAFQAVDKVEVRMTAVEHRISALEQLGPAIQNVSSVDSRLRVIEASMVNASRTSRLVDMALIGTVVMFAMFIASKLGLT